MAKTLVVMTTSDKSEIFKGNSYVNFFFLQNKLTILYLTDLLDTHHFFFFISLGKTKYCEHYRYRGNFLFLKSEGGIC